MEGRESSHNLSSWGTTNKPKVNWIEIYTTCNSDVLSYFYCSSIALQLLAVSAGFRVDKSLVLQPQAHCRHLHPFDLRLSLHQRRPECQRAEVWVATSNFSNTVGVVMIATVVYSLGPHKALLSAFADTAQTVLRLPEVNEHFNHK